MHLPLSQEAERNRILDSKQAAEFLGMSLPDFRRKYRDGRAPPPQKVGERKNGWSLGRLVDHINRNESRTSPKSAA